MPVSRLILMGLVFLPLFFILSSCISTNKSAIDSKQIKQGRAGTSSSDMPSRIKNYLKNYLLREGEGILDPIRFRYEEIDLNNDSKLEVIVLLDDCGTGGCPFLLLHDNTTEFTPIERFTVMKLPLYVEPDIINGWKKLIGYSKPHNRLLIYSEENETRFGKGGYPENPSLAPVALPEYPSQDAVELFSTSTYYFTPKNSYLLD